MSPAALERSRNGKVSGIDYFLPQGTDEGGCYAETCAAIGVIMLAERLLQFDLHRRYADIMELCLYNSVMTAMSLNGRSLPTSTSWRAPAGTRASATTGLNVRAVPPNLTRLFGSLGGYLWDYGAAGDEAHINVHLYTTAKVTFGEGDKAVTAEQTSNWPWEGTVRFRISAPQSVQTTVRLRLPAWSREQFALHPAPSPGQTSVSRGYLSLAPAYVAAQSILHARDPELRGPLHYGASVHESAYLDVGTGTHCLLCGRCG